LIESWVKELRASGSPINEPQVVADAVIKQVVNASGGQVYLPGPLSNSALLRALPNWLQEKIREPLSTIVLRAAKE
jgi:hypothetical protein